MRKQPTRKLSLSRETLSALDGGGPDGAWLRQAAGGGSVRSRCGSCPPTICRTQHVASLCLPCTP
jgi:hypothetical protein